AAPVFGKVMRAVYDDRAVPEWRKPPDVLEYRVDPYTGYVLQDGCQPNGTYATTELFLSDHLPQTDCPYRDWWGDFWDRIGGVFGGDRNRGNDRVDDRRAEQERARAREREIEEFMRERSQRLRERERERARGRGRGN